MEHDGFLLKLWSNSELKPYHIFRRRNCKRFVIVAYFLYINFVFRRIFVAVVVFALFATNKRQFVYYVVVERLYGNNSDVLHARSIRWWSEDGVRRHSFHTIHQTVMLMYQINSTKTTTANRINRGMATATIKTTAVYRISVIGLVFESFLEKCIKPEMLSFRRIAKKSVAQKPFFSSSYSHSGM